MQVMYLKVAPLIQRRMGRHVPLDHRIAMQSASNELTRLLCHLASARFGYQIEQFV